MLDWLYRYLDARRARADRVAADAAALTARFGASAYGIARDRDRAERRGDVIDGARPAGHWGRVKLRIARETGKEAGLDTATRYLRDDATRAPAPSPGTQDHGTTRMPLPPAP